MWTIDFLIDFSFFALDKHLQHYNILVIYLYKIISPVNDPAAGGKMYAAYSEFVEVREWSEVVGWSPPGKMNTRCFVVCECV